MADAIANVRSLNVPFVRRCQILNKNERFQTSQFRQETRPNLAPTLETKGTGANALHAASQHQQYASTMQPAFSGGGAGQRTMREALEVVADL